MRSLAVLSGVAAIVVRGLVAQDPPAQDKIDLSTIDANAALAGNQAFAFIGSVAFSGLGQVRAVQVGGNTYIDVNTQGNIDPDMRIQLTGNITLDALDFNL